MVINELLLKNLIILILYYKNNNIVFYIEINESHSPLMNDFEVDKLIRILLLNILIII